MGAARTVVAATIPQHEHPRDRRIRHQPRAERMKFEPQTARALATGRRDTLRIPAKLGKAGAPHAPCPLRIDQELAIPTPLSATERAAIKRGDMAEQPPLGSVRVVSIGEPHVTTRKTHAGKLITTTHQRPEQLWIDTNQAKAEGHDSVISWTRGWLALHDRTWLESAAPDLAWARSHDRWPRNKGSAEEFILTKRYLSHWAGRLVWTVRFELVGELRYLADPAKGQGDYSRSLARAIDPLPVVDAAAQERYAKMADEFCIGRQLERQRTADEARANGPRQAKRNARVAMFRDAA